MNTKIEYTDETWNPVTGCTPVSPACENCHAKRIAARKRGRFGYPNMDPFRVTIHWRRQFKPLDWRKPRKISVCSMGDFFHPEVSHDIRSAMFDVMEIAYTHTYLLLTKRPETALEFHKWREDNCLVPPHALWKEHIWIGVSCEDQASADERIPVLCRIPAAVRWVSIEPMLGPINLNRALEEWRKGDGIRWAVIGCETGHDRRPCKVEWVRDIIFQCRDAGMPLFVKQIEIDGRVSSDPEEWPEDLRIRQWPDDPVQMEVGEPPSAVSL